MYNVVIDSMVDVSTLFCDPSRRFHIFLTIIIPGQHTVHRLLCGQGHTGAHGVYFLLLAFRHKVDEERDPEIQTAKGRE